jgi:hypothetical protein
MDPRSVVHRRFTADPSPFSPSFSFPQLLQTSSLFRQYSSRSFFTSRRESDPGKSPPSHSVGCMANSWRCILFARVAKRSLTFASLLFSADIFQVQDIMVLYLVTACWGGSVRPTWVPLSRLSSRVVSRRLSSTVEQSSPRIVQVQSTVMQLRSINFVTRRIARWNT